MVGIVGEGKTKDEALSNLNEYISAIIKAVGDGQTYLSSDERDDSWE